MPFAAWLRMSAVVGGSIATLVALPDWLRTMEAKHPASAQLAASMADPIPVAAPTAATPKVRMTGSGSAVFALLAPGKTVAEAPAGWQVRDCGNLEVHPLVGWAPSDDSSVGG
jgi:hypothetical protein